MKAFVALEDGTIFEGIGFGLEGEKEGEIIFNTSMTGHQEIMTDPSYKGQIATMTYPLIGNYGVNGEDVESDAPKVEGFIAREFSKITSNWRARFTFEKFREADQALTVAMKSVGEAMAIGRTFKEAFQKGLRSLDVG